MGSGKLSVRLFVIELIRFGVKLIRFGVKLFSVKLFSVLVG
jgi:hypothetical protein